MIVENSIADWAQVLPVLIAAWAGAAALGYLLLLPGTLRAVRI